MSGEARSVPVSDAADVTLAERRAKAVVYGIGFPESAVEEISIVVRELTSNIIKHATEGTVTVTPCKNDGKTGVEIRAEDFGPGIADVTQALEDGYSTAGSLGCGLGAVHRLMDDVTIGPNESEATGAQIVATRWCSEPTVRVVQNSVTAGAATRPKPELEHNGDTYVINREPETMLVGVIDGLGHGQLAHRASQIARQYVTSHASQSLSRLFRGVEQACKKTRGVVMALMRLDFATGKATIGSVGNIAVKVLNALEPMNAISSRGVLGANAPEPTIREWEWNQNYVLVMHSDGVSPSWSREEPATPLEGTTATDAARELLQSFAEQNDDATVLVVKEAQT